MSDIEARLSGIFAAALAIVVASDTEILMPNPPATRHAGFILIAITLLAIVFMAHHPTVAPSPDIGHTIERVSGFAHASAIVHGALIAALLATAYCLSVFASWRGFERPLVRAGAIAYGAGVVVMIGAALVSGFVVTDVATLMPHDTATDLQVMRQLLTLCGILNQACANAAAVAMSAGVLLCSIDLARERGVARAIGVLGVVVGLVPIVALPIGAIHLDVRGMMFVVLLQAAWQFAVAAWMVRATPASSD
jgi:hypothetical protein